MQKKQEPSFSIIPAILALLVVPVMGIILIVSHNWIFNDYPTKSEKIDSETKYLQESLEYFVDTRTNLCYAKTSVNTLTLVTCSPEVLKIAHPIK